MARHKWTAKRKASLVEAYLKNYPMGDVLASEGISWPEFQQWISRFGVYGLDGLKITKYQPNVSPVCSMLARTTSTPLGGCNSSETGLDLLAPREVASHGDSHARGAA